MNKDTLFKHVVAMGDKSTHGEYKSQAMTDMHREAFEHEFGILPQEKAGYSYKKDYLIQWWHVWQAAMRYRDEQEKQA